MRHIQFARPLMSAALLVAAGACQTDTCLSNRDFFEERVWVPLMAQNCASCHQPGGAAANVNSKFLLYPGSFPNFIDANYANVANVAKIEYNGTSELLLKPLGQMNHGGGAVLKADSQAYADLKDLISRVGTTNSCVGTPPTAALDNTVQLDAAATLKRASIQLTGNMPGADITSRLQSLAINKPAAEGVLRGQLMAITQDPNFYTYLKTMFNDVLLTDRYNQGTDAVNLLTNTDYPTGSAWFAAASNGDRSMANTAVAREPLELLSYIVRNDRPLTELVTANYTVVNPWSAQLYGVNVAFNNPTDPTEYQATQLSVSRNGQQLPLPHAGVLTMPTFLNRFPTTPTNRNRHRARTVLNTFLATDILAFAMRPIDPNAGAAYANPTRDNPQCNVCHKVIDPIAGDFQKWNDYNQGYWDPNNVWHTDMQPPGYGTEVMNTSDFTHSEAWMAQRIATDTRFPTAMLNILYQGVMGTPPIGYPTDPAAANFASQRVAWKLQDALFQQYTANFVASNYNLRSLVVDLIMSPIYRTVQINSLTTDPATGASVNADNIQALSNLGTFRFLTPELLDRKVRAYTQSVWGGTGNPLLLNGYRILYGGIDSDSVTSRLTAPNGLMSNLGMRMATDTACTVVARDFASPVASRVFFPNVEYTNVPKTDDGSDVPANLDKIKANIAYLHQYILNESDPLEIDQTFQLFMQTWQEGNAAIDNKTVGTYLPYQCQANYDNNGNKLDTAINNDPNYVIRAWMAVVTYMLSDYRFLHD